MTFTEQDSQEILDELNEEEAPDPVDQMFGAIGDLGENLVDPNVVLGPTFGGGDKWWQVPTPLPPPFGGLLGLMGGLAEQAFPPDPSMTPTIVPTLDTLVTQELITGDEVVDQAAAQSDNLIKALHYEQMSGEAVFAKFINWLGDHSVTSVRREGDPLGESIVWEEGPFVSTEQGDPLVNIYGLKGNRGQQELKTYLKANWRDVPELVEYVRQNLASNWGEFMALAGTAGGLERWERGFVDAEDYESVLRQFAAFGDDTAVLATLDEQYGSGSALRVVGGALDDALNSFVIEVSQRDSTMMVGPVAPPGIRERGLAQYDEDGNQIKDSEFGQVAFITSFDGTPYGEIQSVWDLFSGGRLGQQNATLYMRDLYTNTKDSTGYSAVVEKIQQDLFAWGVMDEPDEWGKLDITNIELGDDETINALHMIQSDITNTALEAWQVAQKGGPSLAPDGTPYMKDVVDRLVARNVNMGDTIASSARQQEERILQAVSKKIQDRVAANPDRGFSSRGQVQMEATIQSMLDDLGPAQREEYFGRGGSSNERQLVQSLLSQFYDEEDWGSQLFFGGQNSDLNFMQYARSVEALTQGQMDLLDRGVTHADEFRSTYADAEMQKAEEDVATANLLKFIGKHAGGYALQQIIDSGNADAIQSGLITYARTIGQRTAAERGYSDRDYVRMVNNAMTTLGRSPVESPLVSTLDERLAESYNLTGGSNSNFNTVMDAINRRRTGSSALRVRNV